MAAIDSRISKGFCHAAMPAGQPGSIFVLGVSRVLVRDSGGDLQTLRGAAEPFHADAHAPVHPTDKRLLQKGREPLHMVALYTVNWTRIHKTLRVTPAMEAA